MKNIQLFNFNDAQIRVFVSEKGDPDFCAADVTKILGYTNGPKAIIDHCKSDGITKRYTIDSLGREQSYSFLSEANLYRLIMKSTKPEAERFNDWISEEVLPSIRRNGIYGTTVTMEKMISDPDFAINLLSQLKAERTAKELAQETANRQSVELMNAAPKVEYFDSVLQAKNTFTTTTIAKELGLTAQALHKILHKNGIMYFHEGHWVLYAKYQDFGYTSTRTHIREVIENGVTVKKTDIITVWTEKGRQFIHQIFKAMDLKSA